MMVDVRMSMHLTTTYRRLLPSSIPPSQVLCPPTCRDSLSAICVSKHYDTTS